MRSFPDRPSINPREEDSARWSFARHLEITSQRNTTALKDYSVEATAGRAAVVRIQAADAVDHLRLDADGDSVHTARYELPVPRKSVVDSAERHP